MALDGILFYIDGIRIEVQPKLVGHNPLYRVPTKAFFPNGRTLERDIGYDADKKAFPELITISDLAEYWPGTNIPPEILEKRRLTASKVFSTYVPDMVEIQEVEPISKP